MPAGRAAPQPAVRAGRAGVLRQDAVPRLHPEAARTEAKNIVETDIALDNFPQIKKLAFERTFEEIRKARNDNAHHKPFHKTRKRRHQIIEDIELILIHIGFNLNDAINNIDSQHKIIKLKYI